ncbi:MAG: MurR/RpiR family transcriptional regulator [Pseudomonadota bacterium]
MQTGSLEPLSPRRIEGLSPQLRRAARFVVDNPGEVATRSLRHVAQAANLPPPTFSRMARAVGYDSYDQLRDVCRSNLLDRRIGIARKAQALLDGDAEGDAPFVSRHAAASITAIETLLRDLDRAALIDAARLMASARRVVLIGAMSARSFVDYAVYLADMSLEGWSVIGRGTTSLAAETRDLGPQDAALILTMEPYAAQSIETARLVASTGARLIAISDSQVSPVATSAVHSLIVSAESPQFFPSHVAATVLIEALVGMVVKEKGAEAQRRIASTERRSHELREYWRDTPSQTGK